jgi:hypothetical protein
MISIRQATKAALPDWMILSVKYRRKFGRFPDFRNPSTFNEKVLKRIVFSRDPRLSLFVDKVGVRDYVEQRLGSEALPRLYHVTTDPASIPFDELPDRFVVKPSHGSGWVRIVPDKATLDRRELQRTCTQWLARNYYRQTRERAYKRVVPRIMIEELIEDGHGLTPIDYKFYVFNGRVELIHIIKDRYENCTNLMLDRNWQSLNATHCSMKLMEAAPPRPPQFEKMLATAEALGREIDFIRVDLYDTGDRVLFGELTPTPGCGLESFVPRTVDTSLGALWNRVLTDGTIRSH